MLVGTTYSGCLNFHVNLCCSLSSSDLNKFSGVCSEPASLLANATIVYARPSFRGEKNGHVPYHHKPAFEESPPFCVDSTSSRDGDTAAGSRHPRPNHGLLLMHQVSSVVF
jgi:hypothetical protein